MGKLAGQSVVVVGGGFGGLSAACFLAQAGAKVRVLEKNEQIGGRASRLSAAGFRFDMGPSWYLMPDVFERFFGAFGRRPEDFYRLHRLDPHYRIFFKDGDRVDIVPDREQVKALFESYEPGAGAALDRYLAKSRQNYEVGMAQFVYRDRPRLRDFATLDVLRHSWGLSLLGSMDSHVRRYFKHPKLQQIIQYTLVFLGGSPRNTPALYNLMSHVDFNLGVYYPEGGIGRVVDAVAAVASDLGVEMHVDHPVTRIDRDGVRPRVWVGDTPYPADIVLSNADYAHTEQTLLAREDRQYSEKFWRTRTYAPSAFLLYLGVRGEVEHLAHHTLVLPTDWEPHFDRIFDHPGWPEDPSYYLCVPSKTDDTVAPPGHSNLFVLVPIAPGLEDGPEQRARYRDLILDDIARHTGTRLHDRIVFEQSFCVADFADRYNSRSGSALGLAHTLRQTAFLRPRHRSSTVDGLYFTGADTTPGIGVPMNLIGGEVTARMILADRGR